MQKLVGEGAWGFWETVKVGHIGRSRKNKDEYGVHGCWKVRERPDHVLRSLGLKRSVHYLKEENDLFICMF